METEKKRTCSREKGQNRTLLSKKEMESPTTLDMREQLKAIVANEFRNMPALFEELDAKERLAVVCRLIPHLFPKVENIHHWDGEESDW